MKIASIRLDNEETAALVTRAGYLPMRRLSDRLKKDWPGDLLSILRDGRLGEIRAWFDDAGPESIQALGDLALPADAVHVAPLYRRPRKIWGIGLNYKAHAEGLSEKVPESEPASFMKPDTTIIGHGDEIRLPALSRKVTGEAELGLVFGTTCRNVGRDDWRSVLAGFTTVIDMTAEDILRRNPRNLTQAKSFDTFFSFGPVLFTMDEAEDLLALEVRTVLNGEVRASNTVSNMTFPPDILVSYHSQIMTMHPGDIISTGTPGAVELQHGDRIECRIGDLPALQNDVVDEKVQ